MRTVSSFAIAAFLAAALATPTIAPAQNNEKVLIVYGDDPCPTSNGQEIVVCARVPENERYRIPKELREGVNITGAGSWAERAESIEYVGASGVSSCSPVGSGGASGCFRDMVRKARAENKAKGDEPAVRF